MSRNLRGRLFAVFLCGLAIAAARADDPPDGTVRARVEFRDSAGLFNYTKVIPDNAAQSIANVDFQRNKNSLAPRLGLSSHSVVNGGISTPYPNYLFVWYSTTTAGTTFIAKISSRVHIVTSNDGVSPGGGVTPGSGGDNGFIGPDYPGDVEGINFNDAFYLLSNEYHGRKFYRDSGGSQTSVISSTIPAGNCGTVHLNRLLVGCSSTAPNSLFFSEDDNPESFVWGGTDVGGIELLDSGLGPARITGVGEPFFGLVGIYTENGTNILSGTEYPGTITDGNITVRNISNNIGCIHHRTIRNLGNRQYFFSAGPNGQVPGIYRTNGVSVEEHSKQIRTFFKDNVAVTTSPATPSAFIDKDRYCLNVASKNGVGVYYMVCMDAAGKPYVSEDFPLDYVTTWNNIQFAMANHGNRKVNRTYGAIYRYNDGNLNQSFEAAIKLIPWRYRTKDLDFSNENLPKQAIRAYLTYDNTPTSFTVRAFYDMNKGSVTWVIFSSANYKQSNLQTVMYSSSTVITKLIFPPPAEFNRISFDVHSSTYASVDSIDLYATKMPYK